MHVDNLKTQNLKQLEETFKYFGTDGIRSKTGNYPLCVSFISKFCHAIYTHFSLKNKKVLIGHDSRISSYSLISLIAGYLAALGIDVDIITNYPISTPALFELAKKKNYQLGIMISASHNPPEFNGIKLFYNSKKITKKDEQKLTKLFNDKDNNSLTYTGYVNETSYLIKDYIKNLFIKAQKLTVKLLVDTANGALSFIAKESFKKLKIPFNIINNLPNGKNINVNCGITNLKIFKKKLIKLHAELGIIFDGDGDRLLLVDQNANLITGDHILALLTKYHIKNKETINLVIGTSMTNQGLQNYLKNLNIKLIRTDVGDRSVYNGLEKYKSFLGGEPSGHIIDHKLDISGDALKLIIFILENLNKFPTIKNWHKIIKLYPQTIINFKIKQTFNFDQFINTDVISNIHKLISQKEARINIRPSGTEPLLRIMIEAKNQKELTYLKNYITSQVKEYLNGYS